MIDSKQVRNTTTQHIYPNSQETQHMKHLSHTPTTKSPLIVHRNIIWYKYIDLRNKGDEINMMTKYNSNYILYSNKENSHRYTDTKTLPDVHLTNENDFHMMGVALAFLTHAHTQHSHSPHSHAFTPRTTDHTVLISNRFIQTQRLLQNY